MPLGYAPLGGGGAPIGSQSRLPLLNGRKPQPEVMHGRKLSCAMRNRSYPADTNNRCGAVPSQVMNSRNYLACPGPPYRSCGEHTGAESRRAISYSTGGRVPLPLCGNMPSIAFAREVPDLNQLSGGC